jgi:amino acid transporter
MIWLNILGTRKAVRFVEITTLAKLIPLAGLVVIGFFFISPNNLKVDNWPSLSQFGEVSLLLFFAFGGAESSLSSSGEIRNPGKTVPRGLLLGVFMILVLYMGLQLVSTGVMGQSLVNYTDAPLVQVAFEILGGTGVTIILIGTFLSMFGTITGDFLASPRVFFAGSTHGFFPKILSKIHPNYKTPHIAIIVYAAFTFLIAVSGAFEPLAKLSSAALLSVYLLVCIGTIKMRLGEKEKTEGFRLPFGITIPVTGILIVIWFLSNLSRQELITLLGFLLICTAYFLLVIRRRIGTAGGDLT